MVATSVVYHDTQERVPRYPIKVYNQVRPVFLDAPPVVGALADLHVCNQPKKCPAPIGAGPGVGLVESLVAVLRQPLRHVASHLSPNPLRPSRTDLRAGNRLDIDRHAFLNPMV